MDKERLDVIELLESVGALNEEQQMDFDAFIADLARQQLEANE